ncbi:Uncharacterised protein [uncultured archaeon]|nr:Uncharacterised protein [uncultured archaeon]
MASPSEIENLQARNRRVELDKAWETSKTRRAILAVSTYLILVIFLVLINAPNPFVNALVPTFGFLISTFSLSFFKSWWAKTLYKP